VQSVLVSVLVSVQAVQMEKSSCVAPYNDTQ